MKNKAFTLAEIMIVLSIIGILTAILMPIAFHSAPDEEVMKFKKAHNTFTTAILELVNSDKYYLDGDLGVRSDGTLIDGTHNGDNKYFCETLADIISAKQTNCMGDSVESVFTSMFQNAGCSTTGSYPFSCNGLAVDAEQYTSMKRIFDSACLTALYSRGVRGDQIITLDDAWYFDAGPSAVFGRLHSNADFNALNVRVFSPPSQKMPTFYDENGFDVMYKVFCVDIDGVPENSTQTNCINECPFGYGVRADGKIFAGLRADEWLEKSIQKGD